MAYTCKCGKECSTADAARGHVQFSAGEVGGVEHGAKQDLPDGWREMFNPSVPEPGESEPAGEDEGDESDEEPEDGSEPSEASESDGGKSWWNMTPGELVKAKLGGGGS